MALYTDNGGNPDRLKDFTGVFPVAPGISTASAANNAVILPGTYWIMVTMDTAIDIGSDNVSSATVNWVPLSFGTPLPATLSGVVEFAHVPLNLFMEVFQ